ncbi:alkyl hydroperoxide reductase, partial [Burkholderia pseudomallei]|nr:alkyl hydroperoxide reductase [Burkholderia pseudomallei]
MAPFCDLTVASQAFSLREYCCRTDLPPTNRASRSLVKFAFGEEDEHEEALYGTANHRVSEGSRGR